MPCAAFEAHVHGFATPTRVQRIGCCIPLGHAGIYARQIFYYVSVRRYSLQPNCAACCLGVA